MAPKKRTMIATIDMVIMAYIISYKLRVTIFIVRK